jgi:hypothetical protein
MAKILSLVTHIVVWVVFSVRLCMEMMPFATFTLPMPLLCVVPNAPMVPLACHFAMQL